MIPKEGREKIRKFQRGGERKFRELEVESKKRFSFALVFYDVIL